MTVGVVARGQRGVPTGRRCCVVLFSSAGAVRRMASVLSLVSARPRAGRGIVAVCADVVVPLPACKDREISYLDNVVRAVLNFANSKRLH